MTHSLVSLLVYLTQHLSGSLGWAIVALSLGIRVSLLPLTVRLSQRALRNQRLMKTIKPELDELKKRFEKNPQRMLAEMQALYKKHGCSPVDLPALLGAFVQLPVFAMLYGAIRSVIPTGGPFLWIRSLASPDAALVFLILTFSGTAAYFMPTASDTGKSLMIFIQIGVTGVIVWKLSAGLGLYWASSSFVTLGQNLWVRSRLKMSPAAR